MYTMYMPDMHCSSFNRHIYELIVFQTIVYAFHIAHTTYLRHCLKSSQGSPRSLVSTKFITEIKTFSFHLHINQTRAHPQPDFIKQIHDFLRLFSFLSITRHDASIFPGKLTPAINKFKNAIIMRYHEGKNAAKSNDSNDYNATVKRSII